MAIIIQNSPRDEQSEFFVVDKKIKIFYPEPQRILGTPNPM